MRRITIFLLAVMLVLTSINPLCTAAKTVNGDTETASKAAVLTELGILNGYTAEADVTKSMVDAAVRKVIGTDTVSIKFFGSDYRDSTITAVQTSAIMLDIAGYTSYIKALLGSYSDNTIYGYAKKTGVLSGVSAKAGDSLKMADFAAMLYNTMFDVDLMEAVGWSGVVEYNIREDMTVAYKYMSLLTVEGVVYGSGKLNMTTAGELNDENIRIDNIEYTYKKIDDPETVVGRYVKAYMNEDAGNRIMALRILEKKNNVLELESDDISLDSITEREIPYYNASDREMTAKLSATVNVIYNGELVPFFAREDLKADDAYYTLIDSNDDNVYDTVIINKYTPILVWRASNGKVSYTVVDYSNNTYNFDDFFRDGYPFLEENGDTASWRDVGQYDILSLRQTKTGEYNRIIHNIKKVNGTYKKSRSDMKYVTIGDTEYKTTKEFRTNSLMISKVAVGDEVSAFFDAFGRLVGAIPYSDSEEYAAIMNFSKGGDLGGYKIKYLAESGKVVIGTIPSSFTLNGSKITADVAVGNKSNLLFNSDGSVKEQVVKIKSNIEGKIKSIKTADESKMGLSEYGNEDFTLNIDSTSASMNVATVNGTTVADGKFLFDTDTMNFIVVRDSDERCEVSTGKPNEHFKGKLYNIDSDYHVGISVRYVNEENLNREWVNVNSTVYVVENTGVIAHPHKEGELAYAVYAWNNDGMGNIEKRTLICEDGDYTMNTNLYNCMAWVYGNNRGSSGGPLKDALKKEVEDVWKTTKWSELPPGSVISVNQNNGIVINFTIQYLGGSDTVFEAIEDNTINGAVMVGDWGYGVTKTMFKGPALHSYGVVQQVNRFGIVVNNHLPSETEGGAAAFPVADWNRTIPLSANKTIYIFDKNARDESITLATTADIETGDKVYMRHLIGTADMIVVYR